MKNMRGFIDPISLTFALVLGIATLGNVEQRQNDAQMAAEAAAASTTASAAVLQAPAESKLLVAE